MPNAYALSLVAIASSLLTLAPNEAPVDYAKALAIGAKTVRGTVVQAVKRGVSKDPVWTVSVLRGSKTIDEVEIDGESGEVLAVRRVIKSPEFSELRARKLKISASKAAQIALTYRTGEVIEIEQDREGKRLHWDVYIRATRDGKVHEIELDGRNGAFRKLEIED